jgi:hypothetical protein
MTSSSGCSVPSSGVVSPFGTASPLSNPDANSTARLDGGVIPLGATEMNSAGVSPLIGIPAPSVAVTPCIGSTTTSGLMSGSSSGTTGMSGVTSSPGC